MDQGFRRGFTAAEKTELWDRWQRGESLKAIGRAFGKTRFSLSCCSINVALAQKIEPPRDCRRLQLLRRWSHDK